MKSQILQRAILLSLVSLMAIGSAYGVESRWALRVNIPFQFVVGDEVFGPGIYIVAPLRGFDRRIEIRTPDGAQSAVALTIAVEDAKRKAKPGLVFRRQGDQNFLSQIWINEGSTGIAVTQSKREHKRRKSGLPLQAGWLNGIRAES